MNNEKILRYFNMNGTVKFDRTAILFLAAMNLGTSAAYFFILLCKAIPNNDLTLSLGIFLMVLDLFVIIWTRFIKNPLMEFPLLFGLSLWEMCKCGVISFLVYPLEKISVGASVGLEYIAIPLIATSLAGVVIYRKIILLKLLKQCSLKEAEKRFSARKSYWWDIPLTVVPGGFLFLARLLQSKFQISLSFTLWALASVFLFFVLLSGYNLIMAKHYNLFRVYKEEISKK